LRLLCLFAAIPCCFSGQRCYTSHRLGALIRRLDF
jgi:hypothetical protein